MVHTLGDIALSRNKILDLIALQVPHIHVLVASNIMAEVQSNFHGKSRFFIIVIWQVFFSSFLSLHIHPPILKH